MSTPVLQELAIFNDKAEVHTAVNKEKQVRSTGERREVIRCRVQLGNKEMSRDLSSQIQGSRNSKGDVRGKKVAIQTTSAFSLSENVNLERGGFVRIHSGIVPRTKGWPGAATNLLGLPAE